MPNFNYTGYIYRFTNIVNGKMYIGKTFDIKRRVKDHLSNRGNTKIFSKAIKKYERDSFDVDILCKIRSNDIEHLNIVLSSLEIFFIRKYKTKELGYNCTEGGEGQRGNLHTESTKQKISNKLKGRKLSKEIREAISLGHKGHIVSDSSKKKLRETWLKRPKQERDIINAQRVINMQKNRKQTAIKIGLIKRKPILQYSLDGVLLNRFDSPIIAYKFLGIKVSGNIQTCARGKIKTAYGFIWKYEED